MKRTVIALFSFVLAFAVGTVVCAQSTSPSTKWHWDKGTIVVETPARPAGQQSALGLTTPKLETVRVGFAGLGSRGPWASLVPEMRRNTCEKWVCPLPTYTAEKRDTSICASERIST